MTYVHIDIETRSRCDLKARGAYNYAMDISTTILFISWATGNEEPHLWDWRDPFPDQLRDLFEDDEIIFKAHNASFERLLFEYVLSRQVGTPVIPISRFYCTATQARANALPDKLELCARALGAREQKDFKGAALIQKLSIPDKDTGLFCEDPALLQEFGAYCRQDVRTERGITHSMRDLTPSERLDYIVSEEINDRGLMVDVEFAKVVVGYAEAEKDLLKRKTKILTKGVVLTPGSPKFTTWVYDRLGDHKEIMETTSNKSGFTFDADTVTHLYDVFDDLSADCRQAIQLKALSSKSSVSKFKAMVDRADDCDRVCGWAILYGAGQTHRYSSRGLQLHNLPRDTAEDPFKIRDQFIDGTVDKDDLFRLLKSMVRPSLMPAPGHMFVCLDWKSIEAIVLPWSTQDPRADKVLDIFRAGRDIYVETAKQLPWNDRQLGKVTVLSMGYGGGVGAFQSMARGYGVSISDEDADKIKLAWRKANPWAKDFWKLLENTAKRAMRDPGQLYAVGRVSYVLQGGTLWCVLPSGTMLAYPQPRMDWNGDWEQFEISCIKSSRRPKKEAPEWPRMALWGGLLAENITQAIAGDLLREALVRVREWSDEVVLHVHDEIVLEVSESETDMAYKDLREEMMVVPDWATGMPLDCDGWIGDYYRK